MSNSNQNGQQNLTISIIGLSLRTSVNDLYKAFSKFGKLSDCKLVLNDHNESKGYAFLTYTTQKDAQRAIDCTDGKRFDGRILKTSWSLTKEQRYALKAEKRNRARNEKESTKFFLNKLEKELNPGYNPNHKPKRGLESFK